MKNEIIANFNCFGKRIVVVKLEHGTHVMSYEEWKSVYRKLHPERWKLREERKTA